MSQLLLMITEKRIFFSWSDFSFLANLLAYSVCVTFFTLQKEVFPLQRKLMQKLKTDFSLTWFFIPVQVGLKVLQQMFIM